MKRAVFEVSARLADLRKDKRGAVRIAIERACPHCGSSSTVPIRRCGDRSAASALWCCTACRGHFDGPKIFATARDLSETPQQR